MIDFKALLSIDNLVVVCPNSYKNRLLEYFKDNRILIQASYFSFVEYKKNYLFDYDTNTIKYLINKGISINNAEELINNLYFIEDKEYENKKLDYLRSIKKELIDNGLLIFNPLFKEYLSDKNIVVLGYGQLNDLDKSLFKEGTLFLNNEYIKKEFCINEFDNIEEEVEYLYNSIFDLLNNNVDINNIYVLNADEEYSSYFKRYNTYYDFNIEYLNNESILGIPLTLKFIELLENNDKEYIYNYLKDINNELSNSLIRLLNKYAEYDIKDVKDLIINDLNSISINNNYKDVVKCVNDDYLFNDNDHVFLIGFDDNYPILKKDNEYINDSIRPLLNMPLIEDENLLIKNNTINNLSNINNLYMSYSIIAPFNSHNKQTLLEVTCKKVNNSYEYSHSLNKAKYAYKLDELRKYNYKDNDINNLFYNYDHNDYLNYDNSFNGIDYDKDNVQLSYSSMNSYYECSFKYYLDSILKLNENESTFYSKFGSLAHNALKDYYDDHNADFDSTWQKNYKKLAKDNERLFDDESEEFFSNKLKEEIRKDIEVINLQHINSGFSDAVCEQEFNVKVKDNIKFKGFIDKLIYQKVEDHYLTSIVDYKTSDYKYEEKLNEFGLSLQLPCYMYLLRNSDSFLKDSKFVGIYIQNLINKDIKNNGKSLDEKRIDNLKLKGISSDVISRLTLFDTSLNESNTSLAIKGISFNNDKSLSKRAKVTSDKHLEELIDLTKDKIIEAGEDIINGKYTINPKIIDGENKSCTYCKYRDICFRRNKDIKVLYTKDDKQD